MFDLIKYPIRSLSRKKFRTALTILGIAIGVFSLITINNISQAGISVISGELESLGLCGITISSNNPSNILTQLTENELNIIKNNKHVKYLTPLIIKPCSIQTENEDISALLWGINSFAPKIASLDIVNGRQINSKDIEDSANVCVIDQNLANKISQSKTPIGKNISISYAGIPAEYQIIGVTKVGNGIMQNMMGSYVPNFIYIPYTTVQNICSSVSFDQIAIKLNNQSVSDQAGKNIVQSLSFASGIEDGYSSSDFSKQKEALINLLNITTLIFSSLGGISLIVASISTMTIMMVAVNERKREIGIKKSLGATRKTILLEFITEAIIISFLGCIVGLSLGTIAYTAFSYFAGFPFSINLKSILWVILSSTISTTVFSIYPAIRASNMQPVDAFRG